MMGFERFKEVFDCYLALDITAYADLMQIFWRHFFALITSTRSSTLRYLRRLWEAEHSAAWPAVPPHHRCGRVQGGQAGHDGWFVLGVPTPRRVELRGPGALRRQSACQEKFVSGHQLELERRGLALPERARRKSWRGEPRGRVGGDGLPAVRGLRLRRVSARSPSFRSRPLHKELHAQACGKTCPLSWNAPLQPPRRSHLEAHKAYSFDTQPILKVLWRGRTRTDGNSRTRARTPNRAFVKTCVNSIYGKTVQNQEKYLNTTHYFDPVSFSRAQADAAVADFNTEIFEPDALLGTVRRVRDVTVCYRTLERWAISRALLIMGGDQCGRTNTHGLRNELRIIVTKGYGIVATRNALQCLREGQPVCFSFGQESLFARPGVI